MFKEKSGNRSYKQIRSIQYLHHMRVGAENSSHDCTRKCIRFENFIRKRVLEATYVLIFNDFTPNNVLNKLQS